MTLALVPLEHVASPPHRASANVAVVCTRTWHAPAQELHKSSRAGPGLIEKRRGPCGKSETGRAGWRPRPWPARGWPSAMARGARGRTSQWRWHNSSPACPPESLDPIGTEPCGQGDSRDLGRCGGGRGGCRAGACGQRRRQRISPYKEESMGRKRRRRGRARSSPSTAAPGGVAVGRRVPAGSRACPGARPVAGALHVDAPTPGATNVAAGVHAHSSGPRWLRAI